MEGVGPSSGLCVCQGGPEPAGACPPLPGCLSLPQALGVRTWCQSDSGGTNQRDPWRGDAESGGSKKGRGNSVETGVRD